MRMNSQTRIIVFTAIALTAVDLAARSLIAQRTQVFHVNRNGGEVVTAKEFRLVDNDGNLRAHLFTDENNEPGLVLYDRNGTKRAQLDTFDAVPSLILLSPEGLWSSYFGMDRQGLGVLDMFGPNGSNDLPLTSMSASGQRATMNGNANFTVRPPQEQTFEWKNTDR
jgi:hypothetical protein